MGFALLAVLGAERRSGVEVVLELVGLDAALTGDLGDPTRPPPDLLVTGEGALDEQTLAGKAVSGVARRAQAHGIPAVAVCGRRALDDDGLAALGVRRPTRSPTSSPTRSAPSPTRPPLLRRTGRRIAQDWLSRAPG